MSLQSTSGTATGGASQKIAGNASSLAIGLSVNGETGSMSIGLNAGLAGVGNTYIGTQAAAGSTAGSYNAVLGFASASAVASDENVVLGSLAGPSVRGGGRNVLVGARADAGGTDVASVVVGYNARSRGPGAVVLGASAVGGAGANAINIADRITASNGDAGYVLCVGGAAVDFVRLAPSRRVLVDAPLVLTAPDAARTPWWRIATSEAAPNGAYALELRSTNNTLVTFEDEFAPGVLNFTGSHRCALAPPPPPPPPGGEGGGGGARAAALRVGAVLVATGRYRNLDGGEAPGVDEAVPEVDVCTEPNDPRVFGVLAHFEDGASAHRTFCLGNLRFAVPLGGGGGGGGPRVAVNSVGEGGVLVCDWAGPIRNGDLLTSSPVPGLAMRQRGTALRSHTLAKATCGCDFAAPLETTRHGGRAVRVAFVGCSYRC